MKLARLRLTDHLITINEEEWPVTHRHHEPSNGFCIEVRISARLSAYVTASVTQDGKTLYSGKGYLSSYSDFELYRYISMEAFNVAASLSVSADYVWPLIEQFPEFSGTGVKISDAEAFEAPIRDLLARGAPPQEVISSLDIPRELYEFILCEHLEPNQDPEMMADQQMPAPSNEGW